MTDTNKATECVICGITIYTGETVHECEDCLCGDICESCIRMTADGDKCPECFHKSNWSEL